MSGIPVVVSNNGFGLPVKQVSSGAPVMTVATNGRGIPIVLSSRGLPFVVQGLGPPTLATLTLSGTLRNGVPSSGSILGATSGSTIASNVTGLIVNSGARTYTFDGTGAAGTTANGLVETLVGATGSPKNSSITVAAAYVLGTLTLSGSLTNGTSSSGTIIGATTGSTITSNVTGLTVNSGARTYSFDGSATAGTTANGLVETLTGATGSPKNSSITVAAAAGSPTPITKLAAEGDSITIGAGSGINQWMAANSGIPAQNFAIGGSGLGTSSDTPNPSGLTMFARLNSVISYNPETLVIHIGANDVSGTSFDPAEWTGRLWQYVAAARAGASNLRKVIVGTVLPRGPGSAPIDATLFNNNRRSVNALIRAAVGNQIDAYLPYGEHPVLGADATALTAMYDNENLHPQASGQAIMAQICSAVLDPIVALATGSSPNAFAFSDVSNAALSTAYTGFAMLTGMGMGQSATGSVSGAGTFARGTGAFGTSSLTFMNGECPVAKATSSGSYTTAVNTTVTVGSRSDTFTVTTAANVSPVTYATVAGQQANAGFAPSWTGTSFTLASAGRLFLFLYTGGRTAASMKVNNGTTDFAGVKAITSVDSINLFYFDVPAGTYTPSAVSTADFAFVGMIGVLAIGATSSSSPQALTLTAYNNPVDFPSTQPVNANELGFVFTRAPAALTRNDGSTERLSYGPVSDIYLGTTYLTIATLPATATPSFNSTGVNNPINGFAITAAP